MLVVADKPASADNIVDDDLVSDAELALVILSCSLCGESSAVPQSLLQLWRVHTPVSHTHFAGSGLCLEPQAPQAFIFVDGCVVSTFIVQICRVCGSF